MSNFFTILVLTFTAFAIFLFAGAPGMAGKETLLIKGDDLKAEKPEDLPVAVFAGGCFWCIESEFRALNGVTYTLAGYMGGDTQDPSYKDITTGKTGHAEVVEVTFDPEQVSYDQLVEFFLTKAHDPTQLNRQGVDVGTQYRSAIFPVDEDQKVIAEDVIKRIEMAGVYDDAIVTKIEPYSTFWVAEDYHQQYYEKYAAEKGKDHIRVILKKAGQL